jgi:tetratricopeptide (TPR) repeat protein
VPPVLPNPWQPRIVAALALLFAVTALAYLPAMSGGLLWDDDAHVTKPELRSLSGLYRIWFDLGATQQYYPLLHSAFWLEHKLWGDSVVGYHLANLVQHLAAALLVYLILARLKIPGALLATAIFALHPVHVESVAWITEQKNTLSALFYLGATIAYLRYDVSRQRSHYALALVLFVLGLLTKTVTATLPAALLVVFWWQRGRLSWRRDVRPLIPFFVFGAVAGAVTAWVERTLIGAAGTGFELTLLQRGLLAGRVVWFYLGKLFWPTNLIFIYPRWDIDGRVWWQWLFPLATLGVLIGFWLIRLRWRSPLTGWLYFTGTLFPVLGFLNVYPFLFSFVADHFQYLASLGIIALAAAMLTLGIGRLSPQMRWGGQAGCVVLLATLALLTWRQCRTYGNAVTLYQTTLEHNPNCWMARNNLGVYWADAGRYQEALDQYTIVLRLNPTYAEAHNNMGVALAGLGRYPQAIVEYEEALRLRPNYFEAHNNYGNALVDIGRAAEAIDQFQQSLRIHNDNPTAHNNLGNALRQIGKVQEAIDEHRLAVSLQPDFADAHNSLGVALFTAGQREEGLAELHEALRLNTNNAETHNNLGQVLALTGQFPAAIPEFERALELKPNTALVENNLGDALRQSGRTAEAIEHFQRSLQLKPDSAEIYFRLALCYSQQNHPERAIDAAQHALQLARSAHNATMAQQIEAWLKADRSAPQSAPPVQEKSSAP